MNKLSKVGLLVAASLLLSVPASFAQFEDFLGNPTFEGDFSVDSDGNASGSVTGSVNGGSATATFGNGNNGMNGGPPSVGSRDSSEYRATMSGEGAGQGASYGQAAQGDQSHTSGKSAQGNNSQYQHYDLTNTWVEPPARNRSAKSQPAATQEMLDATMGEDYSKASTELLSLDSVNPRSVPSGSFNLGFPGPRPANLWGKTSGWAPGYGAAPHCSTSSCDFNVVDQ